MSGSLASGVSASPSPPLLMLVLVCSLSLSLSLCLSLSLSNKIFTKEEEEDDDNDDDDDGGGGGRRKSDYTFIRQENSMTKDTQTAVKQPQERHAGSHKKVKEARGKFSSKNLQSHHLNVSSVILILDFWPPEV